MKQVCLCDDLIGGVDAFAIGNGGALRGVGIAI